MDNPTVAVGRTARYGRKGSHQVVRDVLVETGVFRLGGEGEGDSGVVRTRESLFGEEEQSRLA